MNTALVTGGAGFLGSHLTDLLLTRGWRVIAVDNCITGGWRNLEHIDEGDQLIRLEQDVVEPFKVEQDVDWIFHFASPASPEDFTRIPFEVLAVNSVGTKNMLELALDKKARFMFASTSEVYGDPNISPQPETYWGNVNPNGIRSVYDESKRFGEAMTMAFHRYRGADVRIVRFFNTYGPRMRVDDGR
ncbi:MAG: NAD-dependent epimerase/dehydratase family protein, partial [Fimbriimonadaceae bacterium]